MTAAGQAEVLIVGLAYRNFDIIKTTLDCLSGYSDKADIFVIDNKSQNSESTILPYVNGLIAEGRLRGVFAFDENIAANAYELAFDSGILNLDAYKYVVVTDLDLRVGPGWLEDHLSILETCPEVFSVSVPLSMENIPPHLLDKYPVPGKTTDCYEEFRPGVHLTTFRGKEFARFLEWRRLFGFFFADRYIEAFGTHIEGKLTTQSRRFLAYHLTWDIFGKDGEYYSEKYKAGATLWRSDKYCAYTYIDRSTRCRCHPLVPPPHNHINRHAIAIVNDTAWPLAVTVDRCWPDGAVFGSCLTEIAAGSTGERGVYHQGRLVVIIQQAGGEDCPPAARVEVWLGSVSESVVLKASEYLPA
jgi:hypothetical protein